MSSNIADLIAKECLNHYQNLPRKGKPIQGQEWTLLSGIVVSNDETYTLVSMATGTKCLGRSQMSSKGDLVNDSHAEVLSRRCFLRYLYDQISKFKNTGSSDIIIGCNGNNKYEINPKIKFHFFSSHIPCGDASIIPKDMNHRKRKIDNIVEESSKRVKMKNLPDTEGVTNYIIKRDDHNRDHVEDDCLGEIVDIHRTGAKCVVGEDHKLPGPLYHTVGLVRTKPGRGDPTLSVSCSDKLARWIACGLQGSLLSLLLSRPVELSSVTIGAGGPYDVDVLKRAIITRTGTPKCPVLQQSTLVFPQSRYQLETATRPCPSAILWTKIDHKSLEVCVEGRRQGATKKCRDNGRLMVCKLELLKTFMNLTGNKYNEMRYRDIKALAEEYHRSWLQVKINLGAWTTKPEHLENFLVS